jgi:HAMP domain-containing protein
MTNTGPCLSRASAALMHVLLLCISRVLTSRLRQPINEIEAVQTSVHTGESRVRVIAPAGYRSS